MITTCPVCGTVMEDGLTCDAKLVTDLLGRVLYLDQCLWCGDTDLQVWLP